MSTSRLLIDHRTHQTPVRQQGDRPTCVGFAVSAAHEWMADDGVIRSAEDAMWTGHQEGGPSDREPISVGLALSGLARLEHADEAAWPYGNPPWPAGRPAAAQLPDRRRSLPSWRDLPLVWNQIRNEIDRGNALVLTLRFVTPAWIHNHADVDAPPGKKAPTNHAVLAVGLIDPDGGDRYTDDNGNQGAVIVKNSWGDQWGDAGYGFVSQQYFDHYGVAAHALER